jgi:hypothetical protein
VQGGLHPRDIEILRTLVRVRYLFTREIIRTFFTCPRVARRRIEKLSDRDLIRPHAKGLPAGSYRAWRITIDGVEALENACPDEPIPDGFVERVADGSLFQCEHHQGLARIYCDLVAPDWNQLKEPHVAARTRRWSHELRRRADRMRWRSDGEVVLASEVLGQRHQIVPDATVESLSGCGRIFLELDRSTKALARVEASVERYRRYLDGVYAHDYSDEQPVTVLFVVRSEGRRGSIARLARKGLGKHRWKVVRLEEAPLWLAQELLDEKQPIETATMPRPLAPSALETAARAASQAANDFIVELRERGLLEQLIAVRPDVARRYRDSLYSLSVALKQGGNHG